MPSMSLLQLLLGYQTDEQYKKTERISFKYAARLDFRETVYPYILLIKANTEFALLIFLWMWACQWRYLEISTLRSLIEVTFSRISSFILYTELCNKTLNMRSTLHLFELNYSFHKLLQSSSFDKSRDRAWWSLDDSIFRCILTSSAKSAMFVLSDNPSTMSLMYIKNNSGPSMEPCGTPDATSHQSERSPSMTKRCFPPVK